jgi:hypothetical protein
MAAIQFDMNLAQHNVSWDDWINTAIALDGLAFGTFWGFDHLFPIGGDLDGQEHECYTTMAAPRRRRSGFESARWSPA